MPSTPSFSRPHFFLVVCFYSGQPKHDISTAHSTAVTLPIRTNDLCIETRHFILSCTSHKSLPICTMGILEHAVLGEFSCALQVIQC